jgi:hypothetical protein
MIPVGKAHKVEKKNWEHVSVAAHVQIMHDMETTHKEHSYNLFTSNLH